MSFKKELSEIKSTLRIDKDIQIKDLENKIKHLEAKLRASTKLLRKHTLSKDEINSLKHLKKNITNPDFLKKFATKSIIKHYAKALSDKEAAIVKYKKNSVNRHELFEFLKERVIKKYGIDCYVELINTVDCPDYVNQMKIVNRNAIN